MPDFTVEAWDSFKQQFLSVIRFILYALDMIFDACRSNPLLYAAFFFPLFAMAFFLVFDLVTRIIPGAKFINEKQVKGVISSSKLAAASYGKKLNSSNSNTLIFI